MNCVTKFIQISTVGNVNKLSETKKKTAQNFKKGMTNTANTKKGDGWTNLKKIKTD